MKHVNFHNKTDLPIMIDFMIDTICVDDDNSLHSIKIGPGEKRYIYSSLGEWIIHSNFDYESDSKSWLEKGYEILNFIGKFNIDKDIFYINNDIFCLFYIESLENEIKNGYVTFAYKKIKID